MEIQCGAQHVVVTNFAVDTDATSQIGLRLSKAPASQRQAAPMAITGGKIEIHSPSGDIEGVDWDDNIAIAFNSVAVQRNINGSTKSAFRYKGTIRSIPSVDFINCTSWNMQRLVDFDAAGVSLAATNPAVAQSFTWTRDGGRSSLLFARESLTAGMSSAAVYGGGLVSWGGQGFIVERPCLIAGVALASSAAITAGSILISVIKNSTFIVASLLNSSAQRRADDFMGPSLVMNSSNFQVAAGDRIAVTVTTSSDLAPTGAHLMVRVILRDIGVA
jgi:hypothetical protein